MEIERKIMFKKNKRFGTKKQIQRIENSVPDFAAQQREFIQP